MYSSYLYDENITSNSILLAKWQNFITLKLPKYIKSAKFIPWRESSSPQNISTPWRIRTEQWWAFKKVQIYGSHVSCVPTDANVSFSIEKNNPQIYKNEIKNYIIFFFLKRQNNSPYSYYLKLFRHLTNPSSCTRNLLQKGRVVINFPRLYSR